MTEFPRPERQEEKEKEEEEEQLAAMNTMPMHI